MDVHDLRSALRLLEHTPGQLLRTQTPVDPNAQLAGVYPHIGAGGTVARPTKNGPAMLYEGGIGHPPDLAGPGAQPGQSERAAFDRDDL